MKQLRKPTLKQVIEVLEILSMNNNPDESKFASEVYRFSHIAMGKCIIHNDWVKYFWKTQRGLKKSGWLKLNRP